MNDIEREVLILNSAWSMIDRMLNWSMFVKDDRVNLGNLVFKDNAQAQLFNILLGDFLSQIDAYKGSPVPLGLKPVPNDARPSDKTFLFHLRGVCTNPQFDSDASELSSAVENFATWIEVEFTAMGVNLGTINIVADIPVTRYLYIKMCGDIAKHNIARLAGNVKHLHKLLKNAGHQITEQEAYLALDPFLEWFQQDILIYHASQIGEYLNNIRWAIYRYLKSEFHRSKHTISLGTVNLIANDYHLPPKIVNPLAKSMYFEIMNRSMRVPLMQQFVISPCMKTRY